MESLEIICRPSTTALASLIHRPFAECPTVTLPAQNLPAQNLLAEEASPYLQQHSGNPVHWRAWSPASLAEAKALERP
ncbi:DUF255 domain-containing protein, partial [Mesorhizobium sp.]|uniref:DUF255 domain-containing protein n=1 Tax=Mesorhizobium sp. TaxID=1871066 RepID=UPI0025CE96FC